MTRSARTAPCLGYALPLLFPDVEPDVLAQEDANDADGREAGYGSWTADRQRTPGVAERSAAG